MDRRDFLMATGALLAGAAAAPGLPAATLTADEAPFADNYRSLAHTSQRMSQKSSISLQMAK